MNRPPLPSFFKIRLSIIVVIFLVFIFLIGLLKSVVQAAIVDTYYAYWYPHTVPAYSYWQSYSWNDSTKTGVYDGADYLHAGAEILVWGGQIIRARCDTISQHYTFNSVGSYLGNRTQNVTGLILLPQAYTYQDIITWPALPECMEDPPPPCEQERAALEQQCGAGNYYIDDETCEGDCKCTDNDNDGICNACDLDANDPEVTNQAWIWLVQNDPDGSVCNFAYTLKKDGFSQLSTEGYYETSKPSGCSEGATSRINMPAIPYEIQGNCTPDNCNVCDDGDGDPSFLIDGGSTNYNPNTPQQPDPDEQANACRQQCFPKAYMYIPSKDQCICLSDNNADDNTNDADPTDGTEKPTGDPDSPDTGTPNEAPADGAGDNELLDSIDENTRATTQNTKAMAEQQAKTNQLLEWVGDNAKATADNTAKLEHSIDGLGGKLDGLGNDINGMGNDIKGLGSKIDGLGDQIGEDLGQLGDELGEKLDQLNTELSGENEPTEELPDEIPEAYSVDEHDWGTRTTQFLSDMRTTGLFAVPTDFLDSVPGGGSPELVIDGGETYGTHTLSFADYSSGLIAIRAAIQLAFMWLAIRIVTLKR